MSATKIDPLEPMAIVEDRRKTRKKYMTSKETISLLTTFGK